MSDLERLDEALQSVDQKAWGPGTADALIAAARAYRDLLANGKRVGPDYVAGMRVLMELAGEVPVLDFNDPTAGAAFVAAVDAAIGDRLLVDPTTEEER